MPVHTDTAPETLEIAFVTAVNILAKKHGCKVTECDYKNRLLEIEGPAKEQLKVGLALEKFLSQWEVKENEFIGWDKIDGTMQ